MKDVPIIFDFKPNEEFKLLRNNSFRDSQYSENDSYYEEQRNEELEFMEEQRLEEQEFWDNQEREEEERRRWDDLETIILCEMEDEDEYKLSHGDPYLNK